MTSTFSSGRDTRPASATCPSVQSARQAHVRQQQVDARIRLQPAQAGLAVGGGQHAVAGAIQFLDRPFIDAIPAVIIVGTILAPLAQSVGMHPIHFAIIGVISIAYGLVTPPYGLCLMIACTVGGIKIKEAIRDTAILFVPMLGVLLIVILAPDATLWLPRLLMPTLVK